MLTKRRFAGCALCAAATLVAGRALAQGQTPQTQGLTRTELRRIEYLGDQVIVQVIVEVRAGVEFPRHTHPGVESGYILEGELVLNVEGQPERTLRRGDGFQNPAGVVHWGKGGASDCRVFATFIVEKDKPLASPA